MASNRISAAMKDRIKAAYNRRISKIDDEIIKLRGARANEVIDRLTHLPEYIRFRKELEKFYLWAEENVPEKFFRADYRIKALVTEFDSERVIDLPYNSELEDMYNDDERIASLVKERHTISKECNQLLWRIEMSPKSSTEYKEAVAKAEEILFSVEE